MSIIVGIIIALIFSVISLVLFGVVLKMYSKYKESRLVSDMWAYRLSEIGLIFMIALTLGVIPIIGQLLGLIFCMSVIGVVLFDIPVSQGMEEKFFDDVIKRFNLLD